MPPAHHQPWEGAEPLLHPAAARSRHPAHSHQPPRPDEAAALGDKGPDLDEGEDVLDGPGIGGVAAIVTKYVRIVRKIRDLVQYGPKNVLYRILRTMGP
jgi:hypothetical protein